MQANISKKNFHWKKELGNTCVLMLSSMHLIQWCNGSQTKWVWDKRDRTSWCWHKLIRLIAFIDIPCSRNMVNNHMIFWGIFMFFVFLVLFAIFGGVVNNKNIYYYSTHTCWIWDDYSQCCAPHWLFTISYPMHARVWVEQRKISEYNNFNLFVVFTISDRWTSSSEADTES